MTAIVSIVAILLAAVIVTGAVWMRDLLRWTRRTDAALNIMAEVIARLQRQCIALEQSEAEGRVALLWIAWRLTDNGCLGPEDTPGLASVEVQH